MEEQNNFFNPYTYMKTNFKVLAVTKHIEQNALVYVGESSLDYLQKEIKITKGM